MWHRILVLFDEIAPFFEWHYLVEKQYLIVLSFTKLGLVLLKQHVRSLYFNLGHSFSPVTCYLKCPVTHLEGSLLAKHKNIQLNTKYRCFWKQKLSESTTHLNHLLMMHHGIAFFRQLLLL